MPISRRGALCVLAGGIAGAAGKLYAQTPPPPTSPTPSTPPPPPRTFEESFRAITPQPTADGDRIEVIDFFWYGCPYCYQLLPLLLAWDKAKPADVVLRRIPAVLRQEWLPDAHLFYTLETLGEAQRLHPKVFEGIHRDRLLTTDTASWTKWAVANGIDRAKWDATYHAKVVVDKVVRAADLARDYDVRATPVMVVDGRYQTGSGQSGSVHNILPTVDGLIKLARERRSKK